MSPYEIALAIQHEKGKEVIDQELLNSLVEELAEILGLGEAIKQFRNGQATAPVIH